MGTEGKVIIIRHGSYINRSHETKIRRATEGEALSMKDTNSENKPLDNRLSIIPMPEKELNSGIEKVVSQTITEIPNTENQTEIHENPTPIVRRDENALPETPVSSTEVIQEDSEKEVTEEPEKPVRSLRPRDKIKPAPRFDDEVYETEDEKTEKAKEKARNKELESWKTFTVYKPVKRFEAINKLITTKWIYTDKIDEKGVPYVKARLVIRGFQDQEKDTVLTESPTAHMESFKIMLALMPTLGHKPRKMDISTAFLQGKELTRPVYIEPPVEANVDESECWLLLKGVYGLSEASRMWYERVHEVMLMGKFKRSAVDPALYFKYDGDNLLCVFLCHVDDFLYGGEDSEVSELEKLIERHFEIREIETGSFMYCGFQVKIMDTEDGFEISYSQPEKIPFIKEVKLEQSDQLAPATRKEERQFRGVLGALQWHANSTRPDLSFGVSKLLGETKSLEVKHCILANKLLRKAKGGDPNQILCKKLVGDIVLEVYTDASFANLRDMGSQRGCIGFLRDKEGQMNLLEYKSNKIKKVCRSTFAAELMACNAAVDHTLSYRSILEAFGLKLSDIYVCTDNNGLRENLNSVVSRCEEKNLRIELALFTRHCRLKT